MRAHRMGQAIGVALLGILAALLLAITAPWAGATEPDPCGTPLLRVSYRHPVDLDHACEGWRRATRFLVEGHGLRIKAPIELAFGERVELDLGGERLRVLGHYDRAARLIRITSMTAEWLHEPDRLMFRLPMDAELHTSLIVHEIAHAVVLDNFRSAEPCRTGGEYLAYVVQLSTMAPEARARVLAQYGEEGFGSVTEITEICHLMGPHEFGVRAYRHFVQEGHGYMLDLILSGGLQADLPL